MTAGERMQAARTALILDEPFFGALALRLKVVEDPGCGTAWVDGQSMGYDPAFIDGLTQPQVVGLVAHEVMHCAAGHPWRRDNRDRERFNIAADYAINYVLAEARFILPDRALRKPEFDGQSAEWIYPRLPKDQQPCRVNAGGQKGAPSGSGAGQARSAGKGQASGQQSGGGAQAGAQAPLWGEVRDAPSAAGDGASEAEWQQAVQQSAVAAKARGKLPSSLDRFVKDTAKPKVDWRSVLHRFVQQSASSDYAWQQPSKRYLSRGLYLPSLRSEEVGPVAVVVDTSGSVDDVTLKQFASELRSVIDDVRPKCVHVIYCDAKVHGMDTFYPDDVLTLKPKGGGGTAFAPALAHVDKIDDDEPVCAIYLTDLYGSFPKEPPRMPVLWATIGATAAPFGEIVEIK